MISIRNLSVSFKDKTVLSDVSLEVARGEFLCLLGQSGCGKSTLLRIIAGLLSPTAGAVEVGGHAVDGPERSCSIVFQDYSLFPWMTTGKNLLLAFKSEYPDKSKAELVALAESYLEMVGLGAAYGKFPAQLSGGMRQRAAIARALGSKSPVLLMDEPFGALDPANRVHLQNLVKTIHRDSRGERTVVFVTHDVDEALSLGTRIAVLGSSPGRLLALEKNPVDASQPRDVRFADPRTRELRERILELYRRDISERSDNAAIATL
jgi:NitT/TauT family transport system ATP-binding protein